MKYYFNLTISEAKDYMHVKENDKFIKLYTPGKTKFVKIETEKYDPKFNLYRCCINIDESTINDFIIQGINHKWTYIFGNNDFGNPILRIDFCNELPNSNEKENN